MDKTTLKSSILGYRELGLSYGDIAKRLKEDYDVDMSRQAIYYIYNKSKSADELNKSTTIILNTTDICNYTAIGITPAAIKEIMQKNGVDISIYKITEIIKKNEEYISDIKESIIEKMCTKIEEKYTMKEIMESIRYKGVAPTLKTLNTYTEDACRRYINKSICKAIKQISESTADNKLARTFISEYNIDKTLGQIRNDKDN